MYRRPSVGSMHITCIQHVHSMHVTAHRLKCKCWSSEVDRSHHGHVQDPLPNGHTDAMPGLERDRATPLVQPPLALHHSTIEMSTPFPAYVVCGREHAIGQVLDGKVAVGSDFDERHLAARGD